MTKHKHQLGRFGVVTPGWVMLGMVIAGVILPIYPFVNRIDGFSTYWPYTFKDFDQSLIVAITLYAAGFAAFIGGLSVPRISTDVFDSLGTLPKPSALKLQKRSLFWIVIGLSSFTASVFLLGGVEGLVSAGADRIRMHAGLNVFILPQNALVAVAIAWMVKTAPSIQKREIKAILPLAIYCLLISILLSLQGAKSLLFVLVLSLTIIWHLKVKSLKILRLAVIVSVLFVSLMIYHVVKQEYLVVGYFVFYRPEDGFLLSFARMLFLQLTGNLMQLQTMAVLVDSIPSYIPYQMGDTLRMLWLIWVPSSLFPGKPLTAPGVFTSALWPDKWELEGTTMPPGIFGEFFMNFGFIGVLLCGFVLGLLYGQVYKRAKRNPSDMNVAVYALFMAVLLHYFRGEVAAPTVLLVSILVPMVLILRSRVFAIRLR